MSSHVSPMNRFHTETQETRGFFEGMGEDLILPSQHFGSWRRDTGAKLPEVQLLAAILEDAVDCFHKYLHSEDYEERKLFRDAERWIMDSTPSRPTPGDCTFSCEFVCDVLGLDAEALRQRLRRWARYQRRLSLQAQAAEMALSA